MNGEYRIKDEKLKGSFERAKSLLRQFESCRIVHVCRVMNKLADRLADRSIDDAARQIGCELKWIERSLHALTREGRKVRTPKDRVTVNGGPE